MTVWLDAHLSPRIARWITERFELTCVPLVDLGLREAEDLTIWELARQKNILFMTKDSDFVDRLHRLGPPPKIIWLTCGNTSEMALKQILEAQFPVALSLLSSGNDLVEIM